MTEGEAGISEAYTDEQIRSYIFLPNIQYTTLGLFYQMSTYVKTIFTTPFKNDEDGELKQQHQNQISVWPWPTFSLILKCTLLIFLITTS